MAKVTINSYGFIILDSTIDGKRHRLTTGKKAEKRLLQWYEKHIEDEFLKLYEQKFGVTNRESTTFKEYGEYILEISSNNRNSFSQKEIMQQFRKLCEIFGDLYLTDIKASHILKWQNTCGFAPKTVQNYRGTLNLILKMALYDEIITKNPLTVVKPPKKVYKETFVFSQEDMKLLISNSTGQFRNMLMFNFFAGLRGSELIALRWDDIDFDANTIRIDTRIRQGIEDVTKSKRVRIIDMLPQAKAALKKQMLITGLKGNYVFLSQHGKVYTTPNVLSDRLKDLCVECGIKAGTMHTVRKSCNTLLKQYGLPQDWILDQLGHVEDGVNREYYTGKIKPDMSKIGRVLAELKFG
ncbi:site-specific integrase [Sulfurovum sp. XGS-02]|uniref:tyrosine-type recombinase/integrase n=1 Tax=Sulfurovum sp. XGS-02 TaxID=2925411 RepID=UPI00205EF12A|nr:site-specific integrase [Sulfurovum sp. XGS-02]UPT76693.1 site-specific integrase [Sulfurovum sp. XGS-02]